MSQLSEEAVRLINEHCEKILKQQKDLFAELNIYKWALRTFFVVVLGGSVFGSIKARDYIDDIVASRIQKQDDLYAAAILSTAGDYRRSLELFDRFMIAAAGSNSTSTGLFERQNMLSWKGVSSQQQTLVFIYLVTTLAGISDQAPNGDFIGKHYWTALLNDPGFRATFLTSDQFDSNLRFNNNYGLGYLRFAENKKDVETGLGYLKKARDLTKDQSVLKGIQANLGYILYMLGDREGAIQELDSIIDWKTVNYRFADLDLKTFPGVEDYFWIRLWKQVLANTDDFGIKLKDLYIEVQKRHDLFVLDQKTASIDSLDSSEKKVRFLETAKNLVLSVQSALKEGNKDGLKTNVSPITLPTYENFIDTRDQGGAKAASAAKDVPQIRSTTLRDAWKDQKGSVKVQVEFEFEGSSSQWMFVQFDQKWLIEDVSGNNIPSIVTDR